MRPPYSEHNETFTNVSFYIRKTAANFNPPMAKAAKITIVEVFMGKNIRIFYNHKVLLFFL